jgi:hypothetical protein
MKRLSFITVFLFFAAVTAKAQSVPYYGEVYEDRPNGKLKSKMWVSAADNFRQEVTDKSGTFVNIFRRDSMTVYRLDMAKKTYMAIPFSQVSDPNSLFGMKMQESANTTSKFIGEEVVEGKTCDHWRYTTVTKLANGQSQTTIYDQWIYKPLNTWIRQTTGAYGDSPEVLRNIVQGAQPAHLFEIPKDFKGSSLPAGGIMEMLTGGQKPAANQQAIDDASKQRQELEKANDPNKTDEQKIQDMLKMLEGMNKK